MDYYLLTKFKTLPDPIPNTPTDSQALNNIVLFIFTLDISKPCHGKGRAIVQPTTPHSISDFCTSFDILFFRLIKWGFNRYLVRANITNSNLERIENYVFDVDK